MAKKKSAKKSSKKTSKKGNGVPESYEFKAPGDAEIDVRMIFDWQDHGEKNATATVLQLVSWNGGEPVYEKRKLYRNENMVDEFKAGDITEVPWHIGKKAGITESDMGKILNAKANA